MKRLFTPMSIYVLLFGLSACGGGNSTSGSFESEITEVSLRDGSIPSGGETEVRVEFCAGTHVLGYDAFGDAEEESNAFGITVFFPSESQYKVGTSKLSDDLFGDVIFGNPDHREPNKVGTCNNGKSFVQYDFKVGYFKAPTSLNQESLALKFYISVPGSAHRKIVSAGVSQYLPTDPCLTFQEDQVPINVG